MKTSDAEILVKEEQDAHDWLKPKRTESAESRIKTDIVFDEFADDYGPSKVVHLYDPKVSLKAIVVIDNTDLGSAIGGVRWAPDVSAQEAFRLARTMTLKNAMAGIPHGGAKSVIFGNPKSLSRRKKEALIRSFARAIKDLTDYIPGPGMGTDEMSMAWINQEIYRSVGVPKRLGGISPDEIGATGLGCAFAAETACRFFNIPIKGARVAIQGFGVVGKNVARFLVDRGARIIAVSDSKGTVRSCDGLNLDTLFEIKKMGHSVIDYPNAEFSHCDDIVGVLCDIWIPAAQPDIINLSNVDQLNCRMIVPGANVPISDDAKSILYHRGIHVVPDFIANSGGVICGSVEYHGGSEQQALSAIQKTISANTLMVLELSKKKGIFEEAAAMEIALSRIDRVRNLD